MKKRFALILAALMLLLPACGQGAAEGSAPLPSEESDPPAQTDAPTQPAGEPAPAFDPSATLEETVLVDESDIKITATGIKYTAYDVKLSLSIENNSSQELSCAAFPGPLFVYGGAIYDPAFLGGYSIAVN